LILDRYKNHKSIEFQKYYKSYNIITLGLFLYSSYLFQPLDIRYFGILKQKYNRQIEGFIKTYIIYITKIKFLIAFKQTYIQSITVTNSQAGFRRTRLIPFFPEIVLEKLDMKLQTPMLTSPLFVDADP
jgi:hypothetical protein